MFEQRDGMLRNILTRAVPALAARVRAAGCWTPCSAARAWSRGEVARLDHACGRPRCAAGASSGDSSCGPQDLRHSAGMLREYGNLSSAFVYFVLEAALAERCGGRLVVAVVVWRRLQLPWRLVEGAVMMPRARGRRRNAGRSGA